MRLAIRVMALSSLILVMVAIAASQSPEVRRKVEAAWARLERVFQPSHR